MKKEEYMHPVVDYNCGYYACEADEPFDETKSDIWQEGYHDKEKERLIRSVKYHLDYVDGRIDCCSYLMDNKNKAVGTEYLCYYYGKDCEGKCYNEMLKDFIRLYTR